MYSQVNNGRSLQRHLPSFHKYGFTLLLQMSTDSSFQYDHKSPPLPLFLVLARHFTSIQFLPISFHLSNNSSASSGNPSAAMASLVLSSMNGNASIQSHCTLLKKISNPVGPTPFILDFNNALSLSTSCPHCFRTSSSVVSYSPPNFSVQMSAMWTISIAVFSLCCVCASNIASLHFSLPAARIDFGVVKL